MKNEHKDSPPPKRVGLLWQLAIGAVLGGLAVVGAKAGFRKLAGWAREGKPEPEGLYDSISDLYHYGAIGGMLGVAASYEKDAYQSKNSLENENAKLKQELHHIKNSKWVDSVNMDQEKTVER